MSRPLDTSEDAWRMQMEMFRRMSMEQMARLVDELSLGVQQLAFAALRARHPDLPDDELWLKLAARRLGVDVVKKVYGREIDPS